jgi:hypothetical protein
MGTPWRLRPAGCIYMSKAMAKNYMGIFPIEKEVHSFIGNLGFALGLIAIGYPKMHC